jgi:hypothetical protein
MLNLTKKQYFFLLCTIGIIVFFAWNKMVIYTDEIAEIFWQSRAYADNWLKTPLNPVCRSNILEIPILFYPAAFVYSTFSLISSYSIFRNITLLIFIIPILVYFYINVDKKEKLGFNISLVLIIFSGTHIIGSGIFRPELFCIITIILGLISQKIKNKTISYILPIFIFIFYTMALYMHPKAIFLLPFLATILYFYMKNMPRIFFWTSMVLFLGASGQFFFLIAKQFFSCPESIEIQNLINKNYVSLGSSNIHIVIKSYLHQIFSWLNYEGIASAFLFKDHSISPDIVPPMNTHLGNTPMAFIFNSTYELLVNLFIFIWVINIFKNGKIIFIHTIKNKFDYLTKIKFELIYISLSIGLFLTMLTNHVQSFYDSAYWLTCILIIGSLDNPVKKYNFLIKYFLILSSLAFISSYIIIYKNITPQYKSGWQYPNFQAGGNLITTRKTKLAFHDLARECGINDTVGNLSLEESAYLYFQKNKNSTLMTYSFYIPKNYREEWYKSNISFAIGKCIIVNDLFEKDSAYYKNNRMLKKDNLCCIRIN